MAVKLLKAGPAWVIREYQEDQEQFIVRAIILEEDDMKELAKRMKEEGF